MEPRISIVTLAVEDLERETAFYEAMGPLLRSDKTYYRMLSPRLAALAAEAWPEDATS